MSKEKLLIQIGDEVIELKGEDKEAFEADRKANSEALAVFEAELKAKQDAQKELKISAYKKLGLTDEEIAAII